MINVLILDDDELFGRTLADRLRRVKEPDMQVISVATADDAQRAVRSALQPFDVMLIDQRLGPGSDGIEVMQSLRRISPESDAIIFTGIDDPDDGLRAYQAGAHRYLPKPFSANELVWIVRALSEQRRIQKEHNWLRILTDVAHEAQRAVTVADMAAIIVRGGRRFGFERGRLWLFDADRGLLIGVCQEGSKYLDPFLNLAITPSESPYLEQALAGRDPVYFQDYEHGPGYLRRTFGDRGFRPPAGEWVCLPLWADERCLGVLLLDNVTQPHTVLPDQRQFIHFYASQVTAALERAELNEREARHMKELEVLNQIGQRVTVRAALDDLDTLLCELRLQVGRLMDVQNFLVALLDPETQRLIFRLDVHKGKPRAPHADALRAGLVGHLIAENKSLLLPEGSKEYRHEHGIQLRGAPAKCWLGVPLRVGDRAVGAIAVQSYDTPRAYSEQDRHILSAVADQVAGAIQTVYLKGQEEESSRQLEVLHAASEAIMKLAQENEEWLWHVTLTAATAEYALSFNRAVLFLAEEGGSRVRGRLGIGHFDRRKASRDWERDERLGMTFDLYLTRLRSQKLRSTDVEAAVRGWAIDLDGEGCAFTRVLIEGQRILVPADRAEDELPPAFVQLFGIADYAVLPFRTGARTIGLVVVDNVHDHEPLRASTLNRLETLLAQSALIAENLSQRQAQDQLVDLNYQIMAGVTDRPLHDTLRSICLAAQAVTGAHFVSIYPVLPDREPFQYDVENIGYAGNESPMHVTQDIRQKGVTSHILRSGTLVVPDVDTHRERFDGQLLSAHPFLRRERIRSFIGTPIYGVGSDELYGALYLDYRMPRDFDPQELRYAASFASLAAVAIRTSRTAQRVQAGLEAVEATRLAQASELQTLRRVLEESLASDSDEPRVVRALLNAAKKLLDRHDVRVGLLLPCWEKPAPEAVERREVRREYSSSADGEVAVRIEPEIYRGLGGHVLQTGETQVAGDVRQPPWTDLFHDDGGGTRSEIDVPIRLGKQVIGVLNAESRCVEAFDQVHRARLERLAAASALALDNVRRQEHLYDVLFAARAVAAPPDLEETLAAVISAVQQAAPGLSAATIWYRKPGSDRLVLGPHFGIRSAPVLEAERVESDSVVLRVMEEPGPIWASSSSDEPRLAGRFVKEESIASTAAFQLRVDEEVVGAMFFNYRQPHEFTGEEKALFPILVEIVASSVRDATYLEWIRRERWRLQAALDVTEAIGTSLDLDSTLRKVMAALQVLFPDATPCVLLYDSTEEMLEFAPTSLDFYPIDNPAFQNVTRVPVSGPSIASRIARQALASHQVEVVNVDDVTRESDYLPLVSTTRSEICIALMAGDTLTGILALESSMPAAFDADDVDLICGVGHQVSTAIDRARQSADLRFKTTVGVATAWAADVAHAINREVGYIRNRAYWLDRDEPLSEEGKRFVREVDASAARLANTLNDAGTGRTECVDLDGVHDRLRPWVEDMVRVASGIEYEFDFCASPVQVNISLRTLNRVVRHLVRNALEAMAADPVPCCAPRLLVSTRTEGARWVQIEIADSGPGIPEPVRQRILREPATSKGPGRGLGLLFARVMVEGMGGTLRLLPTRKDRGATFVITLPVARFAPKLET